MSASEWAKNDAQLVADDAFKTVYAKYSTPVSQEALDKTVKALEEKKHVVKVVENEKEAVEYLASLIKDGSTLSMGTSLTLEQIGFIEYLKSQDMRINNLKGKAAAAAAAGNMALHQELLQQGLGADLFLSSVSAVSQQGDIFAADLTGTRIGGWLAAKHMVVVLGTNKIVADEAEADKRLYDYQLKLESARVRVAYGVPASAVINKVAIRGSNPFGPRSTVVIVKKALGF